MQDPVRTVHNLRKRIPILIMIHVRELTEQEIEKLDKIKRKLTPRYPQSDVPEIQEEWRPIYDLMISDRGRLKKEIRVGRTLVHSSPLKWNFTHDGHPCVNISGSTKLVWQLVAAVFMNEAEFGMDVVHAGHPSNPSVDNLRYVTDIAALKKKNKRMGGFGGKKNNVRFTDYDDEFIVSARINGYPIKVVANYVGCSPAHVTKVMKKFQEFNAYHRFAPLSACYSISG